MEVLTAKIAAMFLLGGLSLLIGLVPLLMRLCCNFGNSPRNLTPGGKRTKGQIFISALSCFGGGVILTTSFTHMLPEVNFLLAKNIKSGNFPKTGMPIAEILVLCGFFMIYIVEELTHLLIIKFKKSNKVSEVNGRSLTVTTRGQSNSQKSGGDLEDVTQPMYENTNNTNTNSGNHNENAASHGHGLDQLLNAQENHFQAALRGFLVILALSLHAIFEGIALGLTPLTKSVWFLFFAIASHKYVISFCVGMQFVSSGVKTWLTIVYVSTFALISPLGTGIGIALSETVQSEADVQSSLVTVLQGLATGTLLYVVFFEVIEKEREKGTNGILQVTFIILGFVCMILLELVELKEESTMPPGTGMKMDQQSANFGSCRLVSINQSWQLPMDLICNAHGYLQPVTTE